jgi:hypothetical protein
MCRHHFMSGNTGVAPYIHTLDIDDDVLKRNDH